MICQGLDRIASRFISVGTKVSRGMPSYTAAALALALALANSANADPLTGKRLAERRCADCHAIPPNETSSNPKAPPFSKLAAEPSITEYSLRAFLRTPHWTMPNLVLGTDDADDVISYIMSLKLRP